MKPPTHNSLHEVFPLFLTPLWIIQPITWLSSQSLVPDCDMLWALKTANAGLEWHVWVCECVQIFMWTLMKHVISLIMIFGEQGIMSSCWESRMLACCNIFTGANWFVFYTSLYFKCNFAILWLFVYPSFFSEMLESSNLVTFNGLANSSSYDTFLLDEERGRLLVGAEDYIFSFDLVNINRDVKQVELFLSEVWLYLCVRVKHTQV